MSTGSDQFADETYHQEDERYEEPGEGTKVDDGEGLWRFWDEGIITLLVVGGAILFLVPEPTTSAIGVLMLGFGVLMWLVDWAT